MALPTKRVAWSSVPLKLISLILGYSFWYAFSHSHTTSMWVSVPVTFYNLPKHCSVIGPETIALKITGRRSDIRCLDFEHLALTVNAEHLKKGKNLLNVDEEQLLLPHSIKLLHYNPSNPIIELVSDIVRE